MVGELFPGDPLKKRFIHPRIPEEQPDSVMSNLFLRIWDEMP
jgi:hypothetical protein